VAGAYRANVNRNISPGKRRQISISACKRVNIANATGGMTRLQKRSPRANARLRALEAPSLLLENGDSASSAGDSALASEGVTPATYRADMDEHHTGAATAAARAYLISSDATKLRGVSRQHRSDKTL